MNKRRLLITSGFLAVILISGCSSGDEKIVGYWRQDTTGSPIAMDIQPDTHNYYVRMFIPKKDYPDSNDRFFSPAKIKGEKIILDRNNRTFVYRSSDDTLHDSADKTMIFKRSNVDSFTAR